MKASSPNLPGRSCRLEMPERLASLWSSSTSPFSMNVGKRHDTWRRYFMIRGCVRQLPFKDMLLGDHASSHIPLEREAAALQAS